MEQIIRFSFHHRSLPQKSTLCANGAYPGWQIHDVPSMTVQIRGSEACQSISFLHHPLPSHCLLSETAALEDCSGRLQTNSYL